MERKVLLPVAQPKILGTHVQQPQIVINQPIASTRQQVLPSTARRVPKDVREWLDNYMDTPLHSILWRRVQAPIPATIGVIQGEWIRLAQQFSNRARFAKTDNPCEIIILHRQSNEKVVFITDKQTASTLIYLTDLCDLIGQLSQLSIYNCLTVELRKFADQDPERGKSFVRELQAFLPRAEIEIQHKQHANSWINNYLPEVEWIQIVNPDEKMRVHGDEPKRRRGRPSSVIPIDLASSLIGGFKIEYLEDIVSSNHLGFYDPVKCCNMTESSNWASLYWALRLAGFIKKIPAQNAASLLHRHFIPKLTSKTRITDIGRLDVIEGEAVKGREVHRIYVKLIEYYKASRQVFTGR
jgi:hypothetical protein